MDNKLSNERRSLRRTAEQMAAWAIVHPLQDEADAKKLLHELQVHQIELEMQNAELKHAQLEAEKTLERLAVINESLQQSMLERKASHSKDQVMLVALLAKLSREIVEPLNVISGLTQQIKQSGANPQMLQQLDKLEVAGRQLLQSVNSI